MTDAFQANYIGIGQGGADPIVYPYVYVAPSNTGVPSAFDLNNSGGTIGGPDDAYGFGFRFNTDNGTILRIDAGFGSRDGKHLYVVFGGVF